jgi:nucleoid DNA-binding protein
MAQPAKPVTKSQLYQMLSEETELTRKQVAAVFDALHGVVKRELSKKGAGVFTLPGLLKLKKVHKKATKARKGINPATKEEITIKARPARTVVKALLLKNLKEMVQ